MMVTRRPRRRYRWIVPTVIILLLALTIYTVPVLVAAARLQSDLRDLQLLDPRQAIGNQSSQSAELIGRTARDLRELRSVLMPLVNVSPAFAWVPRYGGDLVNAPALFEFADHVLVAAEGTLALASAVDAEMDSARASQSPISVTFLRITDSHKTQVALLHKDLEGAAQARARVNILSLSPPLRSYVERMDSILPLWRASVKMLAEAPMLLGATRPKTYLLVAQNSDELRATGGFVSGAALLRVSQGRVTVGPFLDSLTLDDLQKAHPSAPTPLLRYMYAPQWLFRDGNWSPDFPTSARQLQALFKIDRNVETDGVIAVNLRILPEIMDAIGSLPVDDSRQVDATNVVSALQSTGVIFQPEGLEANWWSHRKDLIAKLLPVLVNKLAAGQVDRVKLAQVISAGLMRKDILVYLNEDDLRLGGSLYQGPGDVLMVVDTNVGFNKVDDRVNRQMTYDVVLDEIGGARARVMMRYENTSAQSQAYCVHQPLYLNSYAEMQEGCYWDYLRIYAPAGSKLLRASGELDISIDPPERGRAVFGGFLSVDRSSSRTVFVEYVLPVYLSEQGEYTLHIEKQPGVRAFPVTIRIQLPPAWQVTAESPIPRTIADQTVEFSLTLDKDQDVRIAYEKNGESPLRGIMGGGVGLIALILLGRVLKRRAKTHAANTPALLDENGQTIRELGPKHRHRGKRAK